MNILNQIVTHKTFGKGKIVENNDNSVTVQFESKISKLFLSPDAFCGFLKCEDEELQKVLEMAYRDKVASEKKKQEERRQREEKTRGAKRSYTDKNATENNLAFKCNFCNGGCSDSCLGFKGVCSDDMIEYNIAKERSWCANKENSLCYKYHNGLITREELEKEHKSSPVCYESRMLIDWKAEAGENLRNREQGTTRRIANATRNSLAVLTTVFPHMKDDKNRVIFGVFITGVVDEGDDIQAGYVKAKDSHYIELTPAEAEKMKYWHYYKNNSELNPDSWGNGLYRYLKDTTCARILADIIDVKENLAEKAHAQEMLECYCQLKNIDINNIPQADGAI